ncbi:MAG: endonuclease/exonuclease/phosphatase family protein [Bryobacterales bacterium]|nr:endonuclease/exonuclease/phosphatase family protein [Bryobacterales bacterium]
MISRRVFIQSAAWAASTAGAGGQTAGLTTISYNVLRCVGFPGTGANRERLAAASGQMEARMAQELLLYKPDIVSFCESVAEDSAGRIAGLLGMQSAWFPPGPTRRTPEYPIGFPGAVFTRYRIAESENAPYAGAPPDPALFTRHWGRAVLDAGGERIAFFSAHLHPSDAAVREREVSVILRVMEKEIGSGASVLFQGDLNHVPAGPEYQRWVEAGLTDALARYGGPQQPTFTSVQPGSRLDYIWVAGPLSKRLQSARVLNEGAFRTNPADPASFALSDHLPVLARFG